MVAFLARSSSSSLTWLVTACCMTAQAQLMEHELSHVLECNAQAGRDFCWTSWYTTLVCDVDQDTNRQTGRSARRKSHRQTECRVQWVKLQTCNSLHSTFTISSALADSADAKMLKMPVSLYRLLMAVQLTIQGNWFNTRVYNRECIPLPAPYRNQKRTMTYVTSLRFTQACLLT